MHQAGFSEVTEWNTEFDQILADGQELLSQGKTLEAPEVQALLERDRQTSLASSDCHEQIADRRLRLKNEKAAEFAGLRPTEVDELMSEVES
jgi:hypothetical protein